VLGASKKNEVGERDGAWTGHAEKKWVVGLKARPVSREGGGSLAGNNGPDTAAPAV
jgi:hypothetical protein